MIIYVDMVFFLNVFLDFILLMSVSVVLRRHAKIKRLLLGSLIGGGSTLLLFVSLNSFFSLFLKVILGLFMCIVTFDYRDIRYTLNNMFYLLTTSFSVGGVMYLLMNKGYYNYIILVFGFILVTWIYVKQWKQYKDNYDNYYQVEVFVHGKKYVWTAFLDTGNKLFDNYKHRPVILTSKKIKYHLEDVIYVSYISLNDEKILKCLKTDKIVINGQTFKNYLLGLANQKFMIDGVDCLLHSKMKGELHA